MICDYFVFHVAQFRPATSWLLQRIAVQTEILLVWPQEQPQDKRDVPGTSRPFWSDASRLMEEAGSYNGWGSTRTRAARNHFSQGTRGNFFLTAILAQCRTQILIHCTTQEQERVGFSLEAKPWRRGSAIYAQPLISAKIAEKDHKCKKARRNKI